MTRPTTHPTHTEAVADAAASGFKGANVSDLTPGAESGYSPYLETPVSREIRLLRHEQRTANLIAWHGVIDAEDPAIEDLYSDIYERLELGRRR